MGTNEPRPVGTGQTTVAAGAIGHAPDEQAVGGKHRPQVSESGCRVREMIEDLEHREYVDRFVRAIRLLGNPHNEVDVVPSTSLLDRPPRWLDPGRVPTGRVGDRKEKARVRAELQEAPAGNVIPLDPRE